MLRGRLKHNKRNGHSSLPWWFQVGIALVGLGIVAMATAGGTAYGVYRWYARDLVPPDEMIAACRM